jgi:hypothetical protein
MKRFLPFLATFGLLTCSVDEVCAKPRTKIVKSRLKRTKENLYREFSQTHLRSRIVEIKIKNLRGSPSIDIMWHPYRAQDITKDTFVIVQIIDKFIPNFGSINLKAINPDRMRWTKQIFWNEIIKRKNLIFVVPENSKEDAISSRPLTF